MINRFFVTVLLCLCITFSQALTIEPGKWYDFEGMLGKTNVVLSLYLTAERQLHGNYKEQLIASFDQIFYPEYQERIKVLLLQPL